MSTNLLLGFVGYKTSNPYGCCFPASIKFNLSVFEAYKSLIMQKPVWKKIAEEISLEVSLGRWTVGSIIPNEIDLAKRYKVSRDTMRKALIYLTQQGLFERKPHIGTRVKSRTRTGKFLSELDGIRDIDHYGNQYPRKIQNVTRLIVDDELAERLSLRPGDLVIRFKNIRVASEKVQETVVVTYVYMPVEAAEVLEIVKKRPDELIITLAEEVLGRECDEVKQTFSGTIMPDEVADLFKVPHGTAALKIIRNYMDVRGRTIVASESFHTADRFSFSVAVKKKKY